MCGICGAVGLNRPNLLAEMATCLEHRGPESTGTYTDRHAMLANQRLRVIDVEGGDQPIYNEDGDVVVVYNGEIYNFQILREELETAGHTFTTDTDTEVLVHGYEEWGAEIFERLNGMFAVALWDASDERLLLARDRVGIKPLYYAPVDDGLLFASEPKSILQSDLIEPEVDRQALQYFLQLRYSPSHTTLFDGIETLLPGRYLDIERTENEWHIDEQTFWTPADAPRASPSNPTAAVERALENAVERQLVSDVPLGFYLSGGLDTSSVVAMAAELSDNPIHTFCMGFDDRRWDERPDARAVADHFDTIHHEIEIEQEVMQDFPKMIWHADEPKRNLYPYYVQQAMSEHVTVALGGLGSDELFGGYVYRFDRLRDLQQLRDGTPEQTRTTLRHAATTLSDYQTAHGDLAEDGGLADASALANLGDPAAQYVLLNSTDVLGDAEFYRERMFGGSIDQNFDPSQWIQSRRPNNLADAPLREQGLYWDFMIKLPDDFLLVEDRMSMAHSLESRVPFLDNELVDVALSLPASEKFGTEGATAGKAILRRAMRDRLPDAVFDKDKQGFTMPTFPFVRDELLEHARAILKDPHVVYEGFIDAGYLDDILSRQPSEKLTPHYKFLWKVVALEIWYQMYITGREITPPESIDQYY